MKNLIKNIALAATVVATMASCNDILDLNDTSTFGDVAVWSSQSNADAYVTAAYKTFNDQSALYAEEGAASRNRYYDNYSDLMKSNFWWTIDFNQALMEPGFITKGQARFFDCWSATYSRIKRTNIMLNDLERYGQKWGEEWYNIRRAEGRFCNAINYFFLARVYGGVVIRTDHSGGGGWADDGAYEQDKNRARVSEKETYNHIISELQWAAEYLPEKWDAAWTGRATKGMAYAFLSRIALYAGEWKVAADAAEKCAEYYSLVANYGELFDVNASQDNSKEIIFSIKGWQNVIRNGFDADNRPFGDRAVYNRSTYAMAEPTAELADMYEFKDGTEFSWQTYSANHSDPYTDREPRFHATILYNGAKWEGRTIETFVGADDNIAEGADAYRKFDKNEDADGHTVTGYYLRKYLQEGHAAFTTEGSYNTDIVIRYGEVLLNKAEALAQLDYMANNAKAFEALNAVRKRVGLPEKSLQDAPDLEGFMALIRKERAVELAGEGLRCWDIRRWKLGEKMINGQNVHGVKITKQANGEFTYETVDADGGMKRIFNANFYYLPLPSSEMAQNRLCVDNW